jgi:hypothetical protein
MDMSLIKALYLGTAAVAVSALVAGAPGPSVAQQTPSIVSAVRIDPDDIGGVVTGPRGPEAGVWVIAETTDLPTRLVRIVVTDDQGRYVIPDLPKANYSVWVRGYGLVDSAKQRSEPGKLVNHTAVPAPNAAAAAEYYPALYWYAMLKVPEKNQFPGTGANGIGDGIRAQGHWLDIVKTDGCVTCHQLGNKATRTIPTELGKFDNGADAWMRRIASGQASSNMVNSITRLDPKTATEYFGDWTDRIAKGELPKEAPPRPQGLERNIVVTLWDWGTPKMYLHDEIATDRRFPTVNPYGKIYGAPELSTDDIPVLDPKTHTASSVRAPVLSKDTPTSKDDPIFGASPYWGEEPIWDSKANMHNPMFDEKGRVWLTHRIREPATPAFCRAGSDHPSAKLFPINTSGRQLSMYDPQSGQFSLINTCFSTHHLQFAYDKDNTLWTSGGGQVIGWLNRRIYEETGDEQKAQGWTAMILDTNGNGKRDDYVEPNQPVDPAKDKRIVAGFYGVSPSPADGTIWGSTLGYPGGIVHVIPGASPPATALTEFFEVPFPGYSPRGMDIDSDGVVWAPLASGHFGKFDRRLCKGPMNGPNATGKHCPEGWTLYAFPGPQMANVTDPGSAESSYYSWVDQHDTFGLGKNVPIATGNLSESLIAFKDDKFIQLRVPYPMGFYAKGLDGRIDDANAGWKGRGLWSTTGQRTPFHMEGGKGTLPKVVQFQLRPDPLAN